MTKLGLFLTGNLKLKYNSIQLDEGEPLPESEALTRDQSWEQKASGIALVTSGWQWFPFCLCGIEFTFFGCLFLVLRCPSLQHIIS